MSTVRRLAAALALMLLFCCCAGEVGTESPLALPDIALAVDETVEIFDLPEAQGKITYSFAGDGIAMYGGSITGLVAGSTTEVSVSCGGRSGTFTVSVLPETYIGYGAVEEYEGWYDEISIEPVPGLPEGFAMGMDVSTLKTVIEGGGKFYDASGNRVSVWKLLRDSGVNWIRLRLWNAPYQKAADGTLLSYGGGDCGIATVTEIAAAAKRMGFSLLLDFHYSDFWADPTYQVIPKMWAGIGNSADMAKAIYDFTYQTLSALQEEGAVPDMVQLGNELTSGMLLSLGGSEDGTFDAVGYSGYIAGRRDAPEAVRAPYTGHGRAADQNLVAYVASGARAVRDFDGKILILLQIAADMRNIAQIQMFFRTFSEVSFDVMGISYYPKWHGTVAELENAIGKLSAAFPEKSIAVVETSYAFTFAADPDASNQFGTGDAATGYPVSVAGQADFLRDVIAAVAGCEKGFGVFYWEGAWLPVPGAGWAAANTKNSWANQALFGYGGKALPSLSVFRRVRGE